MRNRVLKIIQAILMIAFMLDCLVLVVGSPRGVDYDPSGGGSLIVIAFVGAMVRRLRTDVLDNY